MTNLENDVRNAYEEVVFTCKLLRNYIERLKLCLEDEGGCKPDSSIVKQCDEAMDTIEDIQRELDRELNKTYDKSNE